MGEAASGLLRAALSRIGAEGVFVLDAEGCYVAFNEVHGAVVQGFLGRQPRIGEPFVDVVAKARGLDPSAFAKAPVVTSALLPRPDGRGSTEVHLEPLHHENAEGVLGRHPAFGPVDLPHAGENPAHRMSELVLNELNNLSVGLAGAEEALASESAASDAAGELLTQVRKRARRAARLGQAIHASIMSPPQELLEVESWLQHRESSLRAEQRIEVSLERGLGRAEIYGDPVELEAALRELLRNAEEARASRAIIRTRTPRSDSGLSTPFWPSIEIVVEDDGEGVPLECIHRVFEPSSTTRRASQGLGLTRVRSIVRAHGGSVRLESPAGRGTVVVLRLPLAPSSRPAAASDPTRPQRMPVGLNIMVVDDAPEVRRVLARVIRHAGHKVTEAEDGVDALEQLEARGSFPDLVVLDLMMPRMDGVETYNALRVRRPNLPILITSGYHPSSLSFLTTDPHALFLPKPFSPSEVLAALEQLIGTAA